MDAVGCSGRVSAAAHPALPAHPQRLVCSAHGASPAFKAVRSWLQHGTAAGRGLRQQRGASCASAAERDAAAYTISYKHLLLAILDENPYLGAGSKQALAATAGLAVQNSSRITVLMVDAHEPSGDPAVRLDTIQWHLREGGVAGAATFLEKALDKEATHNPSVALGDVADEVEADLLLLSSEAVHSKAVDANLLAEFVSCPVLLLP